jgi:hypothetical protein
MERKLYHLWRSSTANVVIGITSSVDSWLDKELVVKEIYA